jgi:hypothetical protein
VAAVSRAEPVGPAQVGLEELLAFGGVVAARGEKTENERQPERTAMRCIASGM